MLETVVHIGLKPALIAVFCYMCSVFVLAQIKRDNGIVDIAWGPGFVLIIWVINPNPADWSIGQWAINLAVHLWALRLAWSIGKRNLGAAEDWRYANWRKEWGKWVVLRSFLQVFMLQGFFMLVIALPVIIVNSLPVEVQRFPLLLTGFFVFAYGLVFEAVGDYQKSVFKSNPANSGKILQSGLWSVTRHPNYFGEAVLWWGIWIMTIGLPWLFVAIALISPITINYLLRFVSGVPMTEEKYEGDPAFEEYKSKVPPFIPKWPWQD